MAAQDRQAGAVVIDSYLGVPWCGKGLHLLEGANVGSGGKCLPCAARRARLSRAKTTKKKVSV